MSEGTIADLIVGKGLFVIRGSLRNSSLELGPIWLEGPSLDLRAHFVSEDISSQK